MFKKPRENKIPDAFSRYVDPTGEFTNRDLRFGEWYVRHRIMLREIAVTLLAVIIVVFGGYSLYRVLEYAFFGYRHDERARTDLTRTSIPLKTLRSAVSAIPLVIDSVSAYPGVSGKYDFAAIVENQNDRWIADVEYQYSWDGGETSIEHSFALPGEKMPLVSIGTSALSMPEQIKLIIKNVSWRRLDNHDYPDPKKFIVEHRDFSVDDFSFTPADGGYGNSASQLKFTVKNNASFGYWQISFSVFFKKGDVVVGLKRFTVDSFAAGKSVPVEFLLFTEGIDIDAVELFPDVDILDSANYLKPSNPV